MGVAVSELGQGLPDPHPHTQHLAQDAAQAGPPILPLPKLTSRKTPQVSQQSPRLPPPPAPPAAPPPPAPPPRPLPAAEAGARAACAPGEPPAHPAGRPGSPIAADKCRRRGRPGGTAPPARPP